MVRWSRDGRAAYEAEREALMSVFLFLTGARCFNLAENDYMRGDGDFFLSTLFLTFSYEL